MKKLKVVLIIGSIYFLCIFGWGVYQYISISNIGKNVEPKAGDVIIVLGAGVWEHGPSPALRGRLDRALEVFNEGLATQFILTGGLGEFPPTEAEAMKEYLLNSGVPAEQIFLEPLATNTSENLQYSKVIMEQQGWDSAIIVTDVFHMKRALSIANDLTINTSGASVTKSVLFTNKSLRTMYTFREVIAMSKYYLDRVFN